VLCTEKAWQEEIWTASLLKKINIYIKFIYSSATNHLQEFKETLLKNLLICISKFLIIIKSLKTSCECKMCKITV